MEHSTATTLRTLVLSLLFALGLASSSCSDEPETALCAAGEACTCESDCDQRCDGDRCAFTCEQGATCDFACDAGGCSVNCADGADCSVRCSDGFCDMSCSASASCDIVSCDDGFCTLDCNESTDCSSTCTTAEGCVTEP